MYARKRFLFKKRIVLIDREARSLVIMTPGVSAVACQTADILRRNSSSFRCTETFDLSWVDAYTRTNCSCFPKTRQLKKMQTFEILKIYNLTLICRRPECRPNTSLVSVCNKNRLVGLTTKALAVSLNCLLVYASGE